MRRLPETAFAGLVVATVLAFFFVQHLKVTTPLIAGFPKPEPAVINPLHGGVCRGVDDRVTKLSFYLLHSADDVDVYAVDEAGAVVRTIVAARHMRRGIPVQFVWDGHTEAGRVARDGLYYIKVALIHQGRAVLISTVSGPAPVRVVSGPRSPCR